MGTSKKAIFSLELYIVKAKLNVLCPRALGVRAIRVVRGVR